MTPTDAESLDLDPEADGAADRESPEGSGPPPDGASDATTTRKPSRDEIHQMLRDLEHQMRPPRSLTWWMIGCGTLAVLAVVAALVIPMFLLIRGAKKAVKEHLELIQAGDYDAAYAMCDPQAFPREEFDRRAEVFHDLLIGAKPEVKRYERQNETGYIVGFIVSDGYAHEFRYRVYQTADGDWQVEDMRITDDESMAFPPHELRHAHGLGLSGGDPAERARDRAQTQPE